MANFEIGIKVDEGDAVESLQKVEKEWKGIGATTKETAKSVKTSTKKMSLGMKSYDKAMIKAGKVTKKVFKGIQVGAKRTAKMVSVLTKSVGGAGLAGALLGLGGAFVAFKRVLDDGKDLQQMAMNTGIAIDKLEEFRIMTSLMGGEMDNLTDAVQDFTEKMGEASADAKSSWAEAFRVIGVTLSQDVAPAIDDTLRALARMVDEGKKSEAFFVGVDLFGDAFKTTFASMVSEGIEPFEQKLKDLQKLKAYDAGILKIQDSFRTMMNQLKTDFGGFLVKGVSEVLPNIKSLITATLSSIGFDLGDMTSEGEGFGKKISGGFASGLDLMLGDSGVMFKVIDIFYDISETIQKSFRLIQTLLSPEKFKLTFELMGNILKQKLMEGMDFVARAIQKVIDPKGVSLELFDIYEQAINDIDPTTFMAKLEQWSSGLNMGTPKWLEELTASISEKALDSQVQLENMTGSMIKARKKIAGESGVDSDEYKIVTNNIDILLTAIQKIKDIKEDDAKTTEDIVSAIDDQNASLLQRIGLETTFSDIQDDTDKKRQSSKEWITNWYVKYLSDLEAEQALRTETTTEEEKALALAELAAIKSYESLQLLSQQWKFLTGLVEYDYSNAITHATSLIYGFTTSLSDISFSLMPNGIGKEKVKITREFESISSSINAEIEAIQDQMFLLPVNSDIYGELAIQLGIAEELLVTAKTRMEKQLSGLGGDGGIMEKLFGNDTLNGIMDTTKAFFGSIMDMTNSFSDLKVARMESELEVYKRIEQDKLDGLVVTNRRKQQLEDESAKKILAREEEISKQKKKMQIANLWMGALSSIPGIWSSVAMSLAQIPLGAGLPLIVPVASGLTSMVMASAGAQTAAIAKYKDGGIVGGESYEGDKVRVGVNSGEAILNYGQQKRLLDIADGKSGGGITLQIENLTADDNGLQALEDKLIELQSNGRFQFA